MVGGATVGGARLLRRMISRKSLVLAKDPGKEKAKPASALQSARPYSCLLTELHSSEKDDTVFEWPAEKTGCSKQRPCGRNAEESGG